MSIYPSFDADYLLSKEDCVSVAESCRQPWGPISPTMPAVGGRIGRDRIAELTTAFGHEVVYVLGSRIQQDSRGVAAAIEDFQRAL
jgi:ribulose-bisphosphate carboxylase large chain